MLLTTPTLLSVSILYYYCAILATEQSNQSGVEKASDVGTSGKPSSHSQSGHGKLSYTNDPPQPKRHRTAFNDIQLDQLEVAFSHAPYQTTSAREALSKDLNITEKKIQVIIVRYSYVLHVVKHY